MKKLLILISTIFIIGGVFSQQGSYNPIYGKQDFKDTVKLSKLKNNAGLNYILSTDTLGRIIKVINPNGQPFCTTTLLSGSVIWVNGFNFSNTKLTYQIGCQLDTASASNFSITGSNDSVPHYTIVWADTSGVIGTTDGMYSGGAAQVPNVNPLSQILLATYLVPINSTQPQGLSNTVVYKENQAPEWVGYTAIPGGLFNYTINPYQGFYSTYIPSFLNLNDIYYTDGSDHQLGNYSFLSFYIRLGQAFTGTNAIVIYLNGSSGAIGYLPISSGNYGFNGALVGIWQLVAFPIAAVVPIGSSTTFHQMDFQLQGNGGALQLDNIILQSGGGNQSSTGVITYNGQAGHVISITEINADSSYEVHIVNNVRTDSTKILKRYLRDSTGIELYSIEDTTWILATGGGELDSVLMASSYSLLKDSLSISIQNTQNGIVIAQDTVVFFGDSYTVGAGAIDPDNKWTNLLSKYLNAIQDNHGVAGSTLMKRTPVDYLGAANMIDLLPDVPTKTFKKKLLILAYGLNDLGQTAPAYSIENFITDYDSVMRYITQTKGWPVKNILLISPYWIGQLGYAEYAYITGNAAPTIARHEAFVQAVKQTATKWGASYFNLYEAQKRNDTTLIATDSIHATDSGQIYIARATYKVIGNFTDRYWYPIPDGIEYTNGNIQLGGGRTIFGGVDASDTMRITSTRSNTKGFIYFGKQGPYISSAFDEENNFWGFGTAIPTAPITGFRQTNNSFANIIVSDIKRGDIGGGGGSAIARFGDLSASADIEVNNSNSLTGIRYGTYADVNIVNNNTFGYPYANLNFVTNGAIGARLSSNGGFSVGTSLANLSAALDVQSTTRGFKPPVMTNAEMLAITSPIAGLHVVNSDSSNRLFYFDGANWVGYFSTGAVPTMQETYNASVAAGHSYNIDFSGGVLKFRSETGGIPYLSLDDESETLGFAGTDNKIDLQAEDTSVNITANHLKLITDPPSGENTDSVLLRNDATGEVRQIDPSTLIGTLQQSFDKAQTAVPSIYTANEGLSFAGLSSFNVSHFTAGGDTSQVGIHQVREHTEIINSSNAGDSIIAEFYMSTGIDPSISFGASKSGVGGIQHINSAYINFQFDNDVALTIDNSHNTVVGLYAVEPSAKLLVNSTTQGVIFSRMTTTQKNAISSPAEGLIIYDLTLHKLCVFTGTVWETVTSL